MRRFDARDRSADDNKMRLLQFSRGKKMVVWPKVVEVEVVENIHSGYVFLEEAFHLFTCDSCDPLTSCTL